MAASPPTSAPNPPTPPAAIDFAWNSISEDLSEQDHELDSLDTKTGVVVGALALAIGFVATAGEPDRWQDFVLILPLGFSLACAAWAFSIGGQGKVAVPEPTTAYTLVVGRPSWNIADMRFALLANLVEAFILNQKRLGRKTRLFLLANAGLVATAVAAVGIRLFGGT